ncbi:fimbria/pilus periplasmic chaperone [Enterobacteriaceae bacterium C23F]
MRRRKSLSVYSRFILAAVLLSGAGRSLAIVNSTQSRLVFNEDSVAETLVLVNSERAPALVQVWGDDNQPLSLPDRISTPLVMVPPVFKLEAGESRNVRVMLLSRQSLPVDREKVYWLNIYQIPPNTQPQGREDKKVVLPIRIRLKVFIRPVGLKAPEEDVGNHLVFDLKNKHSLQITNPTPYYQTIGSLALGETTMAPVMVDPQSSVTVPVPEGVSTKTLSWSVIDDYGKQTTWHRQMQ